VTAIGPGVNLPYTITGQYQTVGFNIQGQAADGWTISFTTPDGNTGQVFVPDAQYNLANVKALVEAKVQTMEDIKGLGQVS
jgi:hypothetical protein